MQIGYRKETDFLGLFERYKKRLADGGSAWRFVVVIAGDWMRYWMQ
jgi:hypothetical protein